MRALMRHSCTDGNPSPAASRRRWTGRALLIALLFAGLSLGAGSVALAQCVDGDGDGYGSPGDPNCPAGGATDCNDGDAAINPGASELCDFVDNDCDGATDEGFTLGLESPASPSYDCNDLIDNDMDGLVDNDDPDCAPARCFLGNGPGCGSPPDPNTDIDCCITLSFLECTGDGLGTFCPVPQQGIEIWAPEGPLPDATCSDSLDNDCDNLTDLAETGCQAPELCNGLDDDASGREGPGSLVYDCNDGLDNDSDGLADILDPDCTAGIDDTFTDLGDPCLEGIGACAVAGTRVCSGDGTGTVCGATPLPPGVEGPPGDARCFDGVDNDCDGLMDLADDDCLEVEKCDGIDNDNDGLTDEDFTDLGDICMAGLGVCENAGTFVCNATQDGTTCNAIPLPAQQEGPAGPTCNDGLDNDCDGFADADDTDCGAAGLGAACALPYILGERGADCNGWHRIEFEAVNAGPNATVTAELIAMDLDGSILAVLPAEDGEVVHLASRMNPEAWDWKTKVNKRRGGPLSPEGAKNKGKKASQSQGRKGKNNGGPKPNWHKMFAPIPLLKVTVKDGPNEALAYCSPVPWMEVLEPNGSVTMGGSGDMTEVLAALPRGSVEDLLIKVDGVDILAGLGIDPAVDLPGGPFNGAVDINGTMVDVYDLVVDVAPSIDELASNTVSMSLDGLECGGHVIVVDTEIGDGVFPKNVTAQCHVDDMEDSGDASIFDVIVNQPVAGSSGNAIPTLVEGRVCHGLAIEELLVQGVSLDVSDQMTVPGDGVNTGDKVTLTFSVLVGETDLVRDISTGDAPIGTFDRGSNRLVVSATDEEGNRAFETRIFATGDTANPGTPPLAQLVMGQVQEQLADRVREAALEYFPAELLNGGTGVEIDDAFVVGIKSSAVQKVFNNLCDDAGQTFAQRVTSKIMSKPPKYKSIGVPCSCDPTVAITVSSVTIDPTQLTCTSSFMTDEIEVAVTLPDVTIDVSVSGGCKTTFLGICIARTRVSGIWRTSLNGITMKFKITEDQIKGSPGPDPDPVQIAGEVSSKISGGVSLSCIGADICEVVATVFTFGLLDLSPDIDISKETQFQTDVGAGRPDPFGAGEITVDSLEVEQFDQTAEGKLSTAEITPDGITLGLKGKFGTKKVDPGIATTPGALLTPAPAPVVPVSNADDIYFAIADDVFDQILANVTLQGRLQSGCKATARTVGDLVPADCESILVGSGGAATHILQGICHAIRGANCETLVGDTDILTARKQGACHGFLGDNCSTIPVAFGVLQANAERNTCENTPDLNFSASSQILFCAKQEVPPRFIINDVAATAPVETVLRMNDISVALVVDRDANGLDGQLSATPDCFASGAPNTGDCSIYGVCLDLNFLTQMQFQDCPTQGRPGLVTNVVDKQVVVRQEGVVCGGTLAGSDGQITDAGATNAAIDELMMSVDTFTPPACADGFDLDGNVQFSKPSGRLISIDTDAGSPFQEYLAVTGLLTDP